MHLLAVAILCLWASPLAAQSLEGGVRPSWVRAMGQGLNVARWWRHQPHDTLQHRARHLPSATLSTLRERGVITLRLLVHPEALLANGSPTLVRDDRVAQLRDDLTRLTAEGFRVVVALHVEPAVRLESPLWREGYVRLWDALSAQLRTMPASVIAYELASEPVFDGREREWGVWQSALLARVRSREPNRLVVLNPARWSSLWALEDLPAITDSLVVVGVHYYDPAVVTHQGADWGGPRIEQGLSGVPFPPNATDCALASADSPEGIRVLTRYCGSSPAKEMEDHFARIVAWRARTGVPVWLSEFGIIDRASPATRRAWLAAVVAEASKHQMPWSLFALDEAFGLGGPASPDWALWAILTSP